MSYMLMQPVDVWESGSIRRRLGDVESAANFLMLKWPKAFAETSLHHEARVAALDALGGHTTADAFREALVAAAAEADVLVDGPASLERLSKTLPGHVARPWDFRKGKRRRVS